MDGCGCSTLSLHSTGGAATAQKEGAEGKNNPWNSKEPVYAASHLHPRKEELSPVLANGSPGSAAFGSAS